LPSTCERNPCAERRRATRYHFASADRLRQTKKSFDALLQKCDLDDNARSAILSALSRKRYSETKLYLLSLLEDITELLSENYFDDQDPLLDLATKAILIRAWQHKNNFFEDGEPLENVTDIDFESLELHSPSEWDRYLRAMTPGYPTLLSDLISVEKVTISVLEYVWCLCAEDLSKGQKRELMNWYGFIAQKLTGAVLQLPDLTLAFEVGSDWIEQSYKIDIGQKQLRRIVIERRK
jgi:hypothetical protein